MAKPLASLSEIRLDNLNVDSGMNNGPAFVEGDVSFSISIKTTFSIGGDQSEAPHVLGRVRIKAKAVMSEDDELLDLQASFVGRYEFDEVVSETEASEFIQSKDYCEMLGLQMQSFVSAKFSELVHLVGLDLRLPLNIIRLKPQPDSDQSESD